MNSAFSHFSAKFHFCVSCSGLVTILDVNKAPHTAQAGTTTMRRYLGWASLGGKQGCARMCQSTLCAPAPLWGLQMPVLKPPPTLRVGALSL